MDKYTTAILIGTVFGILSRLNMLRTDYRQYPTHLHGKIIHISLGVIASGLGAVLVPALLEENYTAITFLALAAQQFRDVRNMERETLSELDNMELVPRGKSYIEGIAMVFEGRNYLVIFTAFISSFMTIWFQWYGGVAIGIVMIITNHSIMRGKSLSSIADIRPASLRFDQYNLFVEDIHIMNIGLQENKEEILKRGIGVIITPKNINARITIANHGQRQAILHDLSSILGVYRDSGTPALVPLSKLHLDDGRLAVFHIPIESSAYHGAEVVKRVTILESAIRMATEAKR
ncbi:MAG: YIEGIA family protein, partial [Bacilli bacterium]